MEGWSLFKGGQASNPFYVGGESSSKDNNGNAYLLMLLENILRGFLRCCFNLKTRNHF